MTSTKTLDNRLLEDPLRRPPGTSPWGRTKPKRKSQRAGRRRQKEKGSWVDREGGETGGFGPAHGEVE
jgi:hypothetical protein